MMQMFTGVAVLLTAVAAWLAQQANEKDRSSYDGLMDGGDEFQRAMLLHIRQDLKLIAFLIAVLILVLGIVADRVGAA